MISIRSLSLRFITAVLIAGPASAQSDQDFISAFAGEWYVFDSAMRDGQNICALSLAQSADDGRLAVTTTGCAAPLAQADSWGIIDGQILLRAGPSELASLGGNQLRITGQIRESQDSLIIERAQGDGNSALIAAALRKHKCYFLGFTQQCATPADLQLSDTATETDPRIVETLATLVTRSQPRRDATSTGNIAQGARVQIGQCLTASDGPWCSARIGENVVWLAMTAVRLEEWPIITFRQVSAEQS